MVFKQPLMRWVGIGVLSLTGLAVSLRALNLVADAMPVRSLPFTLPQARIGSLQISPVLRLLPGGPAAPTPPAGPQKPDVAATKPIPPAVPEKSPAASDAATEPVIVRVKVVSSEKPLTIATSGQGAIALPNDDVVADLAPVESYSVTTGDGYLLIGNHVLPNGALLRPGTDGLVWVNGSWYRGNVRLIWAAGQLHAINEVDLEAYLYGVVGAEMPADWHPEALKAQAIAARSYALALIEQPASPYWDLGNDEAFQVYRGVETETNTTVEAVESTRSTVLVKNNRIFMSQYAATDRISKIAHGGIGKSMSQTGAQKLAQQGATMPQILKHYYPSLELGILDQPAAAQ